MAASSEPVPGVDSPTPDDIQVQARALGDPTRSQIFQYLGAAAHPVDVRELTEHFGFNHNAIRQHLAKLLHAGLIVEHLAASQGRGRPRYLYAQDPAAAGRWGGVNPYERLSELMAEMIHTGDDAIEVGRRAGRRQRMRSADPDSVAGVIDSMARLGFDPVVTSHHGDTVEVVLEACPFATAAMVDPATVCALHRGMTEGLLEDAGSVQFDELTPGDPRRPRCVVRLHQGGADQPPTT